jgi:alpha-L-fucosidase
MKYITITSKHHDGFAMWDSEVSEYNIVDATPYGKDVLRMLADECKKQGLKLFFYHSHLDWHHPDYYPRGRTGQYSGRPESGDFSRYLDYMDAQITELAGGEYGELGGFWFDGWWDQQNQEEGADPHDTHIDWRLNKTYSLINRLQPQALIGNNHHVATFPGETFQMFEKDLPGHNTTGWAEDATISALPLETCETINGAWGHNKNDQNFKSNKDLIHYLVRAAGYNSNFLLNVGPTAEGTLQPEFVERLKAIGQWTKKNGESVYGTRGGPMPPQEWGVMTQKNGTLYVHLMDPGAPDELVLPGLSDKAISSATRLDSGEAVPFIQGPDLKINVPASGRDAIDTILVLSVKESG